MESMKKKTIITTEKREVWIIHPHPGPAGGHNEEIPIAELPLTTTGVPLDEESAPPLSTEQEPG